MNETQKDRQTDRQTDRQKGAEALMLSITVYS